MNFNLYQAIIPTYLQIIPSVIGLVSKAEDFCASQGLSDAEIIQAKLAEDMMPFAFQITQVCHQSMGAIEGVRKGVFSPSRSVSEDFIGMSSQLNNTLAMLQDVKPEEVNEFVGKPMRFEFRDFKINFVAEEFLLSFAQPNFYFHATTVYDILRWKGLPIGKLDFLGELRSL